MKKKETIKSPIIFDDVIKNGFKLKSKYFIICTKENVQKTLFGVAVGKKIGNAVTRNKLKRQIRNIIDNNKMLFKKDRFYIIIGRKECLDITFEEMNNELKKLLLKEKNDEK